MDSASDTDIPADADAAVGGELSITGEGPYRVGIDAAGRDRGTLEALIRIVPGARRDSGGGWDVPGAAAASLARAAAAAERLGYSVERGGAGNEHRRRAAARAAVRCGVRGGTVTLTGDGPYELRISGAEDEFYPIVAAVKAVSGRSYDPQRRCWVLPASSRGELAEALDRIEVGGAQVALARGAAAVGLLEGRFPWTTADLRVGEGRDWVHLNVASDDFVRRLRVAAAAPFLRWSPAKQCLYGLPPRTKAGWVRMCDAFASTGVSMTGRLRGGEPDIGEPVDAERRLAGTPLKLMGFQAEGAAFALRYRRVLIADEPGLGKTIEALAAVAADGAVPAVVVCPAGLRSNWAAETARMCPDADVRVLAGGAQIAAAAAEGGHWDFTIVSYNSLGLALAALPARPAAVILDEAQCLRSPETARTATAARLLERVPDDGMVVALSGTPMPNRPRDLEPLLAMMGRIDRFGGSAAYLEQFCRARSRPRVDRLGRLPAGRFVHGGVYDGAANLPQLWAALTDGVMIRRRKTDVLDDLPEKSTRIVAVDLPAALAELYRRCDAAAAGSLHGQRLRLAALSAANQPSLLDGTAADAPGSAARAVLNEILADGPVAALGDDLEASVLEMAPAARVAFLRRLASAAKLPAVIERIAAWLDASESDRKLVVFAHHRRVVQAIAEHFDAGVIIGGMSDPRRDRVIDSFTNRDEPRLLVCSIAAAGVGINLQRASDVMFAEQPWNPSDCDQAEDRCHRIGQTRGVMVEYIVASGTIDEHVARVVERKRRITGDAIDGGDWESALSDAVAEWMRSRRRPATGGADPQLPGVAA